MSNTVITNYTDLNGPSTKADSSVVVIVNKDGSLSVDQKLLGTLMGTDGSQGAGISVVRVGHEGRPDDATDSESEDDKIPHVTLSVDSYYDEPSSIIKYDSGAEMLQSLRIETRENSLLGFQNDHCYTPLTSPSQSLPQKNDSFTTYDEPVIEITHTPPPKPVPTSKKITILEQQIIPKGKKIIINSSESPIILKGNDVLNRPLPVVNKTKEIKIPEKIIQKSEENIESSSISSSGDSIPDRDSDSDYKDNKDKSNIKLRKIKLKPRILKHAQSKASKLEPKVVSRLKTTKTIIKRENKEKIHLQKLPIEPKQDAEIDLESLLPTTKIAVNNANISDNVKTVLKQTPKAVKKEKKTPAHVTALLSDMTSLFSTPDVIRRVSTDNKTSGKPDKEPLPSDKKPSTAIRPLEPNEAKILDSPKIVESAEKSKLIPPTKTYVRKVVNPAEKPAKSYDLIPLDDASLAQILQDTTGISPSTVKTQPTSTTMNSPGLPGPLSPTLDLLGGLQPEEEGLTEDLLMHVAQLVESSENLQEVIDKQVLGKVDTVASKTPIHPSPFQQVQATNLYAQTLTKSAQKNVQAKKDHPIEIVRRDGRVITLPPIEAPATRSSKRKSQLETVSNVETPPVSPVVHPVIITPEPQIAAVSKQYVNKKLANKKLEPVVQAPVIEKNSAESQESWNSEDDPNRLWCICKQPHNNRFMICCDSCEDWFHGKCVNITKAMGQQMEERGIEWRCPNCLKKAKPTALTKALSKGTVPQKKNEAEEVSVEKSPIVKETKPKTNCIVCKKAARVNSIYCSDACILKHAQDSFGTQGSPTKQESEPGKPQDKRKCESRVTVYDRKAGKIMQGPHAPTAENLKAWLQENPTFEVVRPGALNSIRPNIVKKKAFNSEPNKVQTTLNFERLPKKTEVKEPPPRKSIDQSEKPSTSKMQVESKEQKPIRILPSPKDEKMITQLKTPVTPKTIPIQILETPKPSTSTNKPVSEPRKLMRSTPNRLQPANDKAASVSPAPSRRKDSGESRGRMGSTEPIRDNVRKSLQEQMSARMSESEGPKFTEDEIQQFAQDTETELHELFRDVGVKYKAKYRSLMFNIKDRKNLSLWQKICDRSITPKQLVRFSPEELASQELAQWREEEAKHQLELIKKSELDLLAANKTYVLKTHKGEEVMENKESVSTELDPNVPIEDVVTALNDSAVLDEVSKESSPDRAEGSHKSSNDKKRGNRKRDRENSGSSHSKRGKRDSKRDSENRKSRSSKRKSAGRDRDSREEQRRSTRRSDKKSRARSVSKDRSKSVSKEKSDSSERSRRRSRSRVKSRRRSKSRHSRSTSQSRDRSRSRARSRRRSQSRDSSKRRQRSRSKHRSSTEEKIKQRSKSQENAKIKTDSTDSDSIERPKSAMLKEVHPEYDPHEPMITSAFSEEDLRKSREDVFEEDNYKNPVTEYDPSKTFEIDSSIPLPSPMPEKKQDKVSAEAESDQEPSSTVDNSAVTIWNGCINMVDVARFYVAAYEVSGSAVDLEEDLSTELDIVGRINPDTVWDYISKMKKASNKDIIVLKLQAANDEEKMQYIALYSYLSSRNRLGVVKVSNTANVKDFYIVPLPANTSLPPVLLPLDGPGVGDAKTHLLIAIVIRQRKKRLATHIPKDIIPAKVSRVSRKQSYTPPVVGKSYTPPTSPRRRPLPLPTYASSTLSTTVKDKIAASLASADDDEAYSPGSSNSSVGTPQTMNTLPTSNTLRHKMEELNRQIEEQKQQILKMAQADSSVGGEDEAYSPSRPMTPPAVPLADIALPSNLQEILATIKQRSETTTGDVDMRNLPIP